jgi:Arc/MetJ-type ribon-helix-helix transcriptional regulator
MNRVTISLPVKLKEQTDRLIDKGFYASFSDAVRAALRIVIEKNRNDLLAKKAVNEFKQGKALILADEDDIDEYMNNK